MLNDIKDNEQAELKLLIKQATTKKTKTGKPYLDLVFQDKSGDIPAKLWSVSKEQEAEFIPGSVVEVKGEREKYQGSNQLKIIEIKLLNEDQYTLSDLTEAAPMSETEARSTINDYLFEITNPNLNRIVRDVLEKTSNDFFKAPAAKVNHHDFQGGLAYHTIGMLKLGKDIANLYPQIDRSLLYSGIILHDVGKTIELSGPIGTQYTFSGKLIGHIVISDELIVASAIDLKIDLNSEDVVLLRHLVLSHHGLLEYGSPVKPQTLEALVLNNIDIMDSQINMVLKAENKIEPHEFSKKIYGLDNRSFYKYEDEKKND